MAYDPSVLQGAIAGQQQSTANLGQAGSNLLDTFRTLQGVQQQRQQMDANKAVSAAIQANTLPDGSIDTSAVSAALAGNPAAAYNLPQIQSQLYGAQKARQEAQISQFNQLNQQNKYWGSQLGSLVNKDSLTANDVGSLLVNAVKMNMIQPAEAAQYASQIPKDPAQLRSWVKEHYIATLDNDKQLQALMPQTQVINTGGQQQILNVDPLTGAPRLAGSLTNTLDPGTATSPVQFTGPEGQTVTTTRQNFAGGGYDGRFPGQGGGMGGAIEGPTPAAQAGAVTGAQAQATGSATAANQLANETADAPVRVGYLKQAQSALQNIQTGPGTDWRNQWASALQTTPGLGDIVKAAGVTDPDKIASYDEFKKIMNNYAGNVSASTGTGTDARLNSAISGNANPAISKLANQDIITKTIAAEQYRSAKNQAWQNELNNGTVQPQQYNQWSAQWNKNSDPAVFAFPNMSGEQRQAFIGKMDAKQLNQFKAQLAQMVRSGYIQMPGQ